MSEVMVMVSELPRTVMTAREVYLWCEGGLMHPKFPQKRQPWSSSRCCSLCHMLIVLGSSVALQHNRHCSAGGWGGHLHHAGYPSCLLINTLPGDVLPNLARFQRGTSWSRFSSPGQHLAAHRDWLVACWCPGFCVRSDTWPFSASRGAQRGLADSRVWQKVLIINRKKSF